MISLAPLILSTMIVFVVLQSRAPRPAKVACSATLVVLGVLASSYAATDISALVPLVGIAFVCAIGLMGYIITTLTR